MQTFFQVTKLKELLINHYLELKWSVNNDCSGDLLIYWRKFQLMGSKLNCLLLLSSYSLSHRRPYPFCCQLDSNQHNYAWIEAKGNSNVPGRIHMSIISFLRFMAFRLWYFPNSVLVIWLCCSYSFSANVWLRDYRNHSYVVRPSSVGCTRIAGVKSAPSLFPFHAIWIWTGKAF